MDKVKRKVRAPNDAKDILLLTSARLRRTFLQKDGEISPLNTFNNTLYKPQWSRLSSPYSHGAVTHSSNRPSEAWKHLQNERVWAECKAESWSQVLQTVILHCSSHGLGELSALFITRAMAGTLPWHIPSCIGTNSRERLKAKHIWKGFAGSGPGGLHTAKYRSVLSHFHSASVELW